MLNSNYLVRRDDGSTYGPGLKEQKIEVRKLSRLYCFVFCVFWFVSLNIFSFVPNVKKKKIYKNIILYEKMNMTSRRDRKRKRFDLKESSIPCFPRINQKDPAYKVSPVKKLLNEIKKKRKTEQKVNRLSGPKVIQSSY